MERAYQKERMIYMPELIDKEKVLKYLTPRIKTETPYGEGYNKALEDSAALVALMHTIEPEVRHGRWVVNDRNPDYADCTNCGLSEWIGANGSREYAETLLPGFKKFCPNCGARMDATDTNVGGKLDEEMDLSPLDFLAAEYDRKHPHGIRFVDCKEDEKR